MPAKAKSSQRISLKQTRIAIHRTLDDIAELEGDIPDEYVQWVRDSLAEPSDPVGRLFERTKLDPDNAGHWVALLSYIAEVIYEERRGAPVVWTAKHDEQLVRAAFQIHKTAERKGTPITKEAICEILRKRETYNLKTGTFTGQRRERRTLLRRLEQALTNIEDEFVYPARRKELDTLPKLRAKYETWLNAMRPKWHARLSGSARRRRDKPKNVD
ncbi:hypothetical protein [Bradyrhizobium sp. Bra64]|uniref:hypothetical protein n=1 Tax=Bradyrhizobium sp. Bra64 TaxID=2926009 RepID=UPI002118B3DC|nr:hypothetical protein [Bradyrhizobium sp. Bra64]